MKIINVVYTVKPEFGEQNMLNIKTVMNDLQQLGHPGIFYHSCIGPDGKTFTHTAFYESDDDQKRLNELSSFKHFQQDRPENQSAQESSGFSNPEVQRQH